jgi:galactose mutarotase-like enzyme
METIHLKNKFLDAMISPLGAELQSLIYQNGVQYIWQGNPAFWKRRSPILFPHIGVLKDGKAIHRNGRCYFLGIHGFAKDRVFCLADYQHERAKLVLESDEESLSCYPYLFRLTVEFILSGRALRVSLEVKNTGTETMHFGLGGHPGFCCPLEKGLLFSDYSIVFEKTETQNCPYFNKAGICQTGHGRMVLNNSRILPLRHEDYQYNALLFENLRSSFLELCSPLGRYSLRFSWEGFPYLGIWTLTDSGASFISLEPWTSLPARTDEDSYFDKKHSIFFIESGESYKAWYEIKPKYKQGL